MKRWILFIGILIGLSTIGGAAVAAGIELPDKIAQIFHPQQGDDKIVLVVNGEPIRQAAIRQAMALTAIYPDQVGDIIWEGDKPRIIKVDPKYYAVRLVIISVVTHSEAKRQGIQVSDEEARALMKQQRSIIEAARVAPADPSASEIIKIYEALVKESGLSEDEWWEKQLEGYKNALIVKKLREQVLSNIPPEKQMAEEEKFFNRLIATAKIETPDKSLKPQVERIVTNARQKAK